MNSKKIRQLWLDFFKLKNHLIIPCKSLVPYNDNSLLWINSGVATLKDYFSGKKNPPSKRMVNSQKAIRTNDIENVGMTSRHHTFFEMLGNFSIGDYFKKEAIEYAFEFIFKVLKLNKEKIYFTYFDKDKETKKILDSLVLDKNHIIKGNKDTNFWDVGNGPCGPCMEIFYDRGEKFDKRGIEILKKDIENDRYIEIWNIVFSQFNNDGKNNYVPLRQKNIDTGAGLERIASILQDTPTNFETDLFMDIIKEVEKLSPFKYDVNNYFSKNKKQTKINLQYKIIADHLRAAVNAINDGVKPSNNGRGYVLRRLLRRAYRSALFLEIIVPKNETVLHKFTQIVKDSLVFDIDVKRVSKIIEKEELAFSQTVKQGLILIQKEVAKLLPQDNLIDISNQKELKKYFKANNVEFSFKIAFKLFETFGFPVEILKEILIETYGINLDITEFPKYLEEHAKKSRTKNVVAMKSVINSLVYINEEVSEFIGYTKLNSISKILYLLNEEEEIQLANENDISYVILDKTPFYATAGGQRHDKGHMEQNGNIIEVLDVFKDKYLNHVHKVKGKIDKNKTIKAIVDPNIRIGLERNHSGTHLVFHALVEEFGENVEQLGSDNNEKRLTFDFPAKNKPTWEQLKNVEKKVNNYIAKDVERKYIITDIEGAKKMGAVMTISEYEYMDPHNVRVVHFPNITSDLCGGTHISNTAKLEKFKIISIDSKGSGIYRIKAITSNYYVDKYLKKEIAKNLEILNNLIIKNKKINSNYEFKFILKKDLQANNNHILELIEKVREDYKKLNKSINISNIKDNIFLKEINNFKYYFNFNIKIKYNKNLAATLREKYPNALIIIISKLSISNFFITIASKQYNSNEIAKIIFNNFSGKGGGNAILAQGSISKKITSDKELIKILKQNEAI